MGQMKLYTRGGDDGTTGLGDKSRVGKDHPRIEANGQLDELNAVLGWAAAACGDRGWCEQITAIQSELLCLGAQLAAAGASSSMSSLGDQDVVQLENWIDQACAEVPPLKNFVLPGGVELAARFDFARTVCRRAERAVVHLAVSEAVNLVAVQLINRLADLLFAWARLANHRAGHPEKKGGKSNH